jgi:hypothetical protein
MQNSLQLQQCAKARFDFMLVNRSWQIAQKASQVALVDGGKLVEAKN